mgnify:CR=1 FL=1
MGRVTYTPKIRQAAKEDGHHLITFDACDPKRNGERFTIAVRMKLLLRLTGHKERCRMTEHKSGGCAECGGTGFVMTVLEGNVPCDCRYDDDEYLLQNCNVGFVGNSPMFWHEDDSGYTPWIDEAKRFSRSEAEAMINVTRGSHNFCMWSVREIEQAAKRTVDIQDLRRTNDQA